MRRNPETFRAARAPPHPPGSCPRPPPPARAKMRLSPPHPPQPALRSAPGRPDRRGVPSSELDNVKPVFPPAPPLSSATAGSGAIAHHLVDQTRAGGPSVRSSLVGPRGLKAGDPRLRGPSWVSGPPFLGQPL